MKNKLFCRTKLKHLRKPLFLCLIVFLCIGINETHAQVTTINFESMGLSEGAKPAHPWTYDGFVFDLGDDVGTSGFTYYAGNGEGGTNSMTVEYGNRTVTKLIITKSGGGDFSFHGIWLKKYFGSDTVNIQGWRDNSRIEDKFNFNIATGDDYAPNPAWNVDKIIVRGNIDLDFDNFKYGAPISPNATPTISINSNTLSYTENNAATLIDPTGTVNDSDGDSDWEGGTLTAQITANAESADEISINDLDGDGTTITISGTNILAGGTDIGDLSASGGVVTSGTKLTITFDSDATNANVLEVLRSLRYRNTSDSPGTSNRTITIIATDKNSASVSDTRTVSITSINDEPTLSSTGSNPTFTEGGSAVSLFSSTSASTVEIGQTFSAFTMTVSNVNNGSNERLNVDGTIIPLINGTSGTSANYSLSYNVSVSGTTATISFSGGTLSASALQTIFNAITYINYSNSPNITNRTATITSIKDSGGTANGGDDTAALSVVSTITVVSVNDEPTLTGTGNNPTFTEGGSAVSLFQSTSASTVESGQTFSDFTMTISNINDGSNERLNIDGTSVVLTHGISGTTANNSLSYNVSVSSNTATISFSGGTLSSSLLQTLIDAATYQNNSNNPNTTNRVASITSLKDNGGTANGGDDIAAISITSTITVVSVNDEPALTSTGNNPTFTEGGSAVSLFSSTSASTVESGQTFSAFTMTVTNVNDGSNERLNVDGTVIILTHGTFSNTTNNSISYSVSVSGTTATVSFSSATLSPSSLQTILDAVTYLNISNNPNTTNRVVSITSIKDSGGTANGGDDTAALSIVSTVTVVSVNDEPTLTSTGNDPTFTEGGSAVSLFQSTSASTVESGQTFSDFTMTVSNVNDGDKERLNIDGTTIELTNGTSGTSANNSLSYSVSVSGTTATISFSGGTLSSSLLQTILDAITYQNNSYNPNTTDRTVTITSLKDNGGTANSGDDTATFSITSTITVVSVNNKPTSGSFTKSNVYQNTAYTLGTSNFSYSDLENDPFNHIRISTIPSNGDLWIDTDGSGTINNSESALINNGTVSKSDLDANKLKYLNTNGTSSSFIFEVHDATDYSNASYTATLLVTKEPTVTLSLDPQSTITENSGTTSIKATLSHSFDKNVIVNLSYTGNASGSDYLTSSSITVNSGDTENTITLTATDDSLDEVDETVIVDISSVINGSEATPQQVTATITDDDDAPTVSFTSPSQSSSSESGTYYITAQLSAKSGKTITVPFTIDGNSTATGSGIDYAYTGNSITITPGATSKKISITLASDNFDEEDETIIVNMGTPTNATASGTTSHTITIIDDDDAPTVSFSSPSQSSSNESNTLTIRAQLSAISGKNISVPFSINSNSTATGSGTDYSISASPLTITAGNNTADITITIVTDNLDEENETIIIDMGTPVNATASGNTSHTATITDDDIQPTVSFTTLSQSSTNETGTLIITAEISGKSGKDITIPFNIDGTSSAEGNGADYVITASPLTISKGATVANIAITIVGDTKDEVDETVIVKMGTPTNATATGTTTHTVTITDDDNEPTVEFTSASQSSANESGTLTITAELSAISGKVISVPFTLDGNSTASGSDYSISSSPLIIPAGSATANITITINNDTDIEDDETIIVNMGTPVNASKGTVQSHTATITDDEKPLVNFSTVSQSSLNESGSLTFTAELSRISNENISIPFSINGSSTATNIIDYTISSSPITITAGQTTGTISVDIVTDTKDEPNETIIVEMGTPTNAIKGSSTTHTITITDDDNTPVITASQSFSVNEDAINNTSFGTVAATDADAGTTFSGWAITAGNTDNIFAINPGTGDITVNSNTNLDYETTTSYILSITVSDGENTSAAENVTININPVNDETPVVTASQSFSVNEDAANDTSLGTVVATDADAGTTFQNWTITAGNEDNIFAINPSTGEITVGSNTNLDYESKTSYTISVTVSDGINTSTAGNITININPINDETPIVTANQVLSVNEDAANNATIGTVLATDDDAGTTFSSWTIAAGNSDNIFAINPSSGEVTVSNNSNMDYESTTSYILSITVSDGVNTSTAENVTININPVNDEKPVVTAGQSFTVMVDAANNSTIGTVKATDPDADISTTFQNWTITVNTNPDSDANETFSIDASSGVIKVNDTDDLNLGDSHPINVTVSDGVNVSSEETVTIIVIPSNIAPIITSSATAVINENTTAVTTVTATDDDNDTPTFSLTGGDDNTLFEIDENSGELSFKSAPNFESPADSNSDNVYIVEVSANDGNGGITPQSISVTVTDVNDAPIVDNKTVQLDENSDNATIVTATTFSDEDSGQAHSYSIVSGNEDGTFSIARRSGQISINDNTNLNYEVNSTFTLTVQVSDNGSPAKSSTGVITINLNDVNDAPVVNAQTVQLDENSDNATVVTTATFTDEDSGQAYSYSIISGNDDGVFGIARRSGQISVLDNTKLNYEETSSFNIEVQVTDNGSPAKSSTGIITVNINDVNDAPVVNNQTIQLEENTANSTVVASTTYSDEDSGQRFSFSIVSGNDDGVFGIARRSGQISIVDNTNLDYEENTSFSITVQVTDNGSPALSSTGIITFNITDVNEPAVITTKTLSVAENSPSRFEVGKIVVTDDNDLSNITFRIIGGNDEGYFSINENTGVISVEDGANLDYENKSSHELTIRVVDNSGDTPLNTDAKVIINLSDINEAPTVQDQTFSINEDVNNGDVVAQIDATDPDENSNLTYTVSGTNPITEIFDINSESGQITVKNNSQIDYDNSAKSYNFNITVSDGTFESKSAIVININNVNDIPHTVADKNLVLIENSPLDTEIGSLEVNDPDNLNPQYTYTIITGNTNDVFSMNENTIVVAKAEIDFETINKYELEIEVKDDVFADTAKVVIDITDVVDTGIDDIFAKKFTVYPVPAIDNINISNNDNIIIEKVSLINMTGNTVKTIDNIMSGNISDINISELPSGIYLLKITANGKTTSKRIVIK